MASAPHAPEAHGHAPAHGADDAHAAAHGPEDHVKKEKKEEKVEKHDDKTKKTISKTQEEVNKHVHDAVPTADAHTEHPESKPTEISFKPFPGLPSFSTSIKALTTVGAVMAPTAVLPAAAAVVGGKKIWNVLAKVPGFSLVDKGVRKMGSVVKEGFGGVKEFIKSPFSIARWGIENTIILGRKIVTPPLRLLKTGLHQLYVDTRKLLEILAGIPHDSKNPVNIVTGTAGVAGNAIKNVGTWCWHHPKTAIVLGAVLGGSIAQYGFVEGIATVGNTIYKIFTSIANKIMTSAGPVPAPVFP